MSARAFSALLGAIMAVGLGGGAAARPQAQPPVRGQTPDLGRPTRGDDQLPLFNFDDYFTGAWSFEWDVPEGPLGSAGRIAGTTTYRTLGNGFYQAETRAMGPDGSLDVKEVIAYRRESKTLARSVSDSRGFSFLDIGPIGGDLGGYYNIYFDSAPFQYGGKVLRLKTAMHLLSPLNYRVAARLSVDGGPFLNYGNPWWRKNVAR